MPERELLTTYPYSYSGADCRAYTFLDGMPQNIVPIESLHTISWSVHEAKGPARSLGYRGVKGYAKGIRTIAGSLILTVLEDNPLRPFLNNFHAYRNNPSFPWHPGWSMDKDEVGTGTALDIYEFSNRLAPLLPPCNILLQYVSESAMWAEKNITSYSYVDDVRFNIIPGAAMMLRGVEFIDEGGVTSVNDIVTEISLSFVAQDYKPLSINTFTAINNVFDETDPFNEKNDRLHQMLFQDTIQNIENNKRNDLMLQNTQSTFTV